MFTNLLFFCSNARCNPTMRMTRILSCIQIDLEVIKRSTEGSILAERTNHSQRLDMMKEKAKQRR